MVFPPIEFAVFFPPVLALSWALMPRPRLWKPFILAMSYVFYAAAEPEVLPADRRRDARQPGRRDRSSSGPTRARARR